MADDATLTYDELRRQVNRAGRLLLELGLRRVASLVQDRMRRYEDPHLVNFVEELPRTLTGKVQRFRLREWATQLAEEEPETVTAETDPGASFGSP